MRLRPLTGYMGSKRQDASTLTWMLGLGEGVDEVVLVDAGPWGEVWSVLSDAKQRAEVIRALYALHTRGTLDEVWPTLLHEPPKIPALRVAQYLCLQARAASAIPVWWSEENSRWESPTGSKTEAAHQRGGSALKGRMKSVPRKRGPAYASGPSRGQVRIATLAERVEALGAIDWGRVTALQVDVREVEPISGSIVYFDPPYAGAPRYAELLPRADVLEVALHHVERADHVCVSEAEPLQIEGWHHQRLRPSGKPEWLTMSREPDWLPPEQMRLL